MASLEGLSLVLGEPDRRHLRRHLQIPGQMPEAGSHRAVRLVEPYPFEYTFRSEPHEDGRALLDILCERFPFRSAAEWRDRISGGLVLINGEQAAPESVVHSGNQIAHRNTGVVEPSVPDEIEIIAENEHIMVIDKPAPMPVHAGGRYHKNTVISVLSGRGHDNLRIVHRLDAVTAGVLVLAKSEEVARRLQSAIQQGRVRKGYEAIVSGNPAGGEAVIRRGIRRKRGFVFECSDDAGARAAETRFSVLEQGDGWARVWCEPVTGRTHQIRLHLREWGHPVWDDPVYAEGDGAELQPQNRGISLVSVEFNCSESLP